MSKHILNTAVEGIEVKITFEYTPGAESVGPSYASGNEPGGDPTVEFLRCDTKAYNNRPEGSLTTILVTNFFRRWLNSPEGYAKALEQVAYDHEDARERAAEMRAER